MHYAVMPKLHVSLHNALHALLLQQDIYAIQLPHLLHDMISCRAYIGLLERIQQITAAAEQLSDENGLLRQQAGLLANEHIDVSGVRLARVSVAAAPFKIYDANQVPTECQIASA